MYSTTVETESSVQEFITAGGFSESTFIVMINAYFDDSGDPKREKWSVVGGLVGEASLWSGLEIDWALETYDLKKPFRSTECECQHGQFATWDKRRCDRLMAKLTGLIRGHKIPGWGAIVDVEAYRRIFPGSGEYDPFFLAIKHTIALHAKLASKHSKELAVWFEESHLDAEINRIYKSLKAVPGWRYANALKGITFRDKGANRLQAADLMAREAYKHVDNFGKRPTRKPLLRLKGQWDFQGWTEADLLDLRARGGPDNLSCFTTDWNEQWEFEPDPNTVMDIVNRPFDA